MGSARSIPDLAVLGSTTGNAVAMGCLHGRRRGRSGAAQRQQKELTATLGTVGATHVRFLFGLPFGVLFLAFVLVATGLPIPPLNAMAMIAWTYRRRARPDRCHRAHARHHAASARSWSPPPTPRPSRCRWPCSAWLFWAIKVTPRPGAAILVATAGVLLVSWPRSNSGRGLHLEAGGARHRLGRPVCHRRHRLSRRHPGARDAELRAGGHHDAGAGPRHPDA